MALDSSPFLRDNSNCSSVNDSFGMFLANETPNSQVRKLKEKVKLWKGRYKSLREKSLPRAAAKITKNKVLGKCKTGKLLYIKSPNKANLANFYRLKYLKERQNNQELALTLASERNECTKLFEASLSHQRDFMALQQGIEQAVSDRVIEVLTELTTPLKRKVYEILDSGKSQVDLMVRDMLSALGNGTSYSDDVAEEESRQLTSNNLSDSKTQRSSLSEMTDGNSDRNISSVSRSRCRVLPMIMGHVLQKPKLALPKMDLHEIQRRNREIREMEQVPDMSLINEDPEGSLNNTRRSSESINSDNLSLVVTEEEQQRSFHENVSEAEISTSIDESPINEQRSFLAPSVTRISRRNIQSLLNLKLRPQILLPKIDTMVPNLDSFNESVNSPSNKTPDLRNVSVSLNDISSVDPLEGPSWLYQTPNTEGKTSDKSPSERSSLSKNLKINSPFASNGVSAPMVQIHSSVDDVTESSENECTSNRLSTKSKRQSSKGKFSSASEGISVDQSSGSRRVSMRKSQIAPTKVNSLPKPAPRLSKKKSNSDIQLKSTELKLRESSDRVNETNKDESSILRSVEESTNINESDVNLSVLVTVPQAQSRVTNCELFNEDNVDDFKVPDAVTRRKKSSIKNLSTGNILKVVKDENHTLLFENESMDITFIPEPDKRVTDVSAKSKVIKNSQKKVNDIILETNTLENAENTIIKDNNRAKIFNLSSMEETVYTIEPFRTKNNGLLSEKELSIVLTDCLKEKSTAMILEESLLKVEDLENDLNVAASSQDSANPPPTVQKNNSKRVSFHSSVPSAISDSNFEKQTKRTRKSLKDATTNKNQSKSSNDIPVIKSRHRVAVITTSAIDSDPQHFDSIEKVEKDDTSDSEDYAQLPTKRKSRRSKTKIVDASSLKRKRTGKKQTGNIDNVEISDEEEYKFERKQRKLRNQTPILKDSSATDHSESINDSLNDACVMDIVPSTKQDIDKVNRNGAVNDSLLGFEKDDFLNCSSPNISHENGLKNGSANKNLNGGKESSSAKSNVKKLRNSEHFEKLAFSSDEDCIDIEFNSSKSLNLNLGLDVEATASETSSAANFLQENLNSSSDETVIFQDNLALANGTESQVNMAKGVIADENTVQKSNGNRISLADLENAVDIMIVDREEIEEELPDITIEDEVSSIEVKKDQKIVDEPIKESVNDLSSVSQVGGDTKANGDTGGYHPRRAASRVVSYKEPSLMSKLRKGDSSSDASSSKKKNKKKSGRKRN